MMIKKISILGGYGRAGNRDPVDRVDLAMGDVLSIVGQTGSGKTALINDIGLFANENTPSRRRVLINDAVPSSEFLDDPSKKMSKSDANPGHAVNLLDSTDAIRSKIMKATTDSKREICFDEKRPGIYNLLVIYELFSKMSRKEITARFEGKGYAQFKNELAEAIIEGLRPLQLRYRELTADPHYLDSLLAEGSARVKPVAEKTLSAVQKAIGLVPPI